MYNAQSNNLFQINKEKNLIGAPPSCFDDIIRSIAYMNNCSYEMFYSNRWYFDFDKHSNLALVNRVINCKNNDNEIFLKQLYDIQGFSYKAYNREKLKQSFLEIILNNKYLIAFIDDFWIPWDGFYQNTHNRHAIVILDVNIEEKEFICCDPYNNIDKIDLSYENFFKSIREIIVPQIVNVEPNSKQRFRYFETIINDINENMFDSIHALADCIYMGQNIKELFLVFHNTAWYRWTFGVYLSSLNDIDTIFSYYGSLMQNIAVNWNNIKLSLIKCECLLDLNSPKATLLLNYICDSLHEVAEKERLLYKYITNKETIKNNTAIEICNNNNSIHKINIQSFFNNIGISNSINIEDKSDFTGTGEYIVLANNRDNTICIGNGKRYDNISCNGQVIKIDNYVTELILFGCCEWGSYRENIIINKNSSPKELPINISDYSAPIFDEEIFISGSAYSFNNELHKTWDKVSIYKIVTPVMCLVDSIQLPVCPNMHIMAIQYT